jgi:hypothetical protein
LSGITSFPNPWPSVLVALCGQIIRRIKKRPLSTTSIVTHAVALQNLVDQTQASHMLKFKGIHVRAADLAFLSRCATSKLKRVGDYPTGLKPEAMPTRTTLPL